MLLERIRKKRLLLPHLFSGNTGFNHPENIERTITAALNGSAHPFYLEINHLIMPL